MGSAAYFWARASGALLVCLRHYVVQDPHGWEVLLYVDDFMFTAVGRKAIEHSAFMVFMLCVLGMPFRWDKFRGGVETKFVGYWVDFGMYRLGISERRAEWLAGWPQARLSSGKVDLQDLAAVLGRMCFALGPLEFVRPFLAPLYAWSASVGRIGMVTIPWSVLFLFRVIRDRVKGDGGTVTVRPQGVSLGLAFRADAKAEGQTVAVGGWECLGGCPPGQARWFAVR